PRVLENARPEAAVAVGAAFYGRLRQNPDAARRLLIRAGSARAYYIGVNVSQGAAGEAAAGTTAGRTAVCVMPKGTQEGSRFTLDREFVVTSNRPAAFTLYSTTQRDGTPGEIVTFTEADEDVLAHAPLVTAFRFGKRSRQVPIPVRLATVFTETGTLELWCES